MDNVADRLMVVKGDGLVRLFEGPYGEVSTKHATVCTAALLNT